MDVRPIRTQADYEWALGEVERYFDVTPKAGTAEADRFDVLSELIAAYEDRAIPLPDVDPIDALAAHMEETGRSQSDLAELFASRSRASEVLSRKRPLTVEMIYRLDREWDLPASLLVRPARAAA